MVSAAESFPGFTRTRIHAEGAEIHTLVAGSGPPVLLLHGYPQTHLMWRHVAPRLAEEFTVVATDLRGYGDSSKPASDAAHLVYSKRAMAEDQVQVMKALGHETFHVVGHDRGARVGHRMALDFPRVVNRLAVLDIVPTRELFITTDKAFAEGYYHWFFLSQPAGFPEHLIGLDPDFFLREKMKRSAADSYVFEEAVMDEYLRCFRDPEMIRASCEDYRAATTIDLEHDEADRDRKLECPVLALWGAQALMGRTRDVLSSWREYAKDVRGEALPCGHYLPEELPEETLAAMLPFLREEFLDDARGQGGDFLVK